MNVLQRFSVPVVSSICMTFALLYLMFLLVHTEHPELAAPTIFKLPPISYTAVDADLKQTVIKPQEPEPVEPAPDVPSEPYSYKFAITGDSHFPDINIEQDEGINAVTDHQLVLALGYPPVYPQIAINREVEGYAVVGFSVSASGTVFDAYIIESEPASIFDKASLKAIKKFKYKARIVGGKPVATDGQRYLFRYALDAS